MDDNLKRAAEAAERHIFRDWDKWWWEELVLDVSNAVTPGLSCAAIADTARKCRKLFGAAQGQYPNLTAEQVVSFVLFSFDFLQSSGSPLLARRAPSQEERWEPIRAALAEFQKQESQSPRIALQSATDKTWSEQEYMRGRPPGFPSSLAGVYVVFDEDGNSYIGSATGCFDKRVWTHDEMVVRRRWIDIIAIHDNVEFWAPKLESFLIGRLQPFYNTIGK